MHCTNCDNGEYKTTIISKEFKIKNKNYTIKNIECEKCNVCGDIIFTHKQSLKLEKKRIDIENNS